MGTKLNEAYTKILKDIEDVESDDFNNLADRLYFLLKQDIWIQNRDKNFYMKVTNEVLKQCDRHLLYEESVRFFMIQKSIEREIYIKKKQWWRYCTSLISLTVSRHFTSALQLFVFLMIFTFANSSVVGIITESSNIIKNFNDTLATLDNTGAGVVCTLNAWYVFNIYLQLVGMILFGTFVNVLQQKIKR